MTFNENVRVNTGGTKKRSGGARGGMLAGGGIGVAVVVFLISQFLGVDLSALTPVAQELTGGSSSEQTVGLEECETGADANRNDECRMAAAADSLERYWVTQVGNYRSPQFYLYNGSTQSQCGTASSATGPFYCPPEEAIYMDVAFFETLRAQYGASGGPLAQMYVLAHEWGHHVSKLIGTLDTVDRGSGAASDSVRLELQADCFAGAWVGSASTITDDSGVPFLQPVSRAEISDALNAAATVGDDHIMETAGVEVNTDRFTHGTSEQRQRWFLVGYEQGPTACSTFDVPAGSL